MREQTRKKREESFSVLLKSEKLLQAARGFLFTTTAGVGVATATIGPVKSDLPKLSPGHLN